MKQNIYTSVTPLYLVEGILSSDDDRPKQHTMFFFAAYSDALKKGSEMLYQNYCNVSVCRCEEFKVKP